MADRFARSGYAALRRIARVDPITLIVITATVLFVLIGIGSPLLGLSVYADTGMLANYGGYRDVLAGVRPQTVDLRDLVDASLPNSILFGEAIRAGDFAAWNPYPVGGDTLGSTPNYGMASPLSLPFWFLPGWMAPAYVSLLEVACAVGGTYLFLRRLRLGAAAAWLGGVVYASSAFMVVWSGWPHTRVAAFVPALFWAVECLAQRMRVREVALVALAVAGLVIGGFPSVTGYALLTAAIYLLTRVAAEHGRDWRAIARRLGAATAGLAAGVGIAAFQLVPWIRHMASILTLGRSQEPNSHIPGEAVLTAIAPYAFGTVDPSRPPDWFGGLRLIDADAYVGSAALVLAISAVALAGPARARLPRGVWWMLVATTAGWTVVIFFGGPLLYALQRLPFLFSDNFVGRGRSLLGFLLAVLAAVGFDVLIRRAEAGRPLGRAEAGRPLGRFGRRYGIGVWAGLAAGGLVAYLAARRVAARPYRDREPGEPDFLAHLHRELAVGLVLLLVAAACVAWLWFGRRDREWTHTVAAVTLVLLVAGQALWFVRTYHPRTDRDTFYPTTPTQTYLAANLGHQRFYGADGAIFGSVDVTARLRSFHGHAFIQTTYGDLAAALPTEQFFVPPTAIVSDPLGGAVAASPVLDRAAVSHYIVPPEVRPFGEVHIGRTDGATVVLVPERPVTVPLEVSGPVRGIGLTVDADLASSPVPDSAPVPDSSPVPAMPPVTVVLRDATGAEVARGERRPPPADRPGAGNGVDSWTVPLMAERVPPGTRLTAEITLHGPTPVTVAAGTTGPALTVITPADDGLRMVYAAETVIYQRIRALDRARWASAAVVEPDPRARVQLLAAGSLRPDQVVLDGAGPAPDGGPAEVTWVEDGLDEMVLSVRARGTGYLVLADALQVGWRVTVDGEPAPVVRADHAFVAVAVGPGTHTVRWYYPWPWAGVGIWITITTLLIGLAAFLAPPALRRWPALARPLLRRPLRRS
jgi:hypothetical protein